MSKSATKTRRVASPAKPKAKREILLRTSERTAFKRCRWAWDVQYNEQLEPKVSTPPLRFGTLIHKAMELRYPPGTKRGPHPARTFEKLYAAELEEREAFGFRDEDGNWASALEMGVDMLEHYVEVYGKDEEWKVIASELAFRTPVFETATTRVMYAGIIDGVWQNRSTKEIWLRDWKTTKSISPNHGKHLTLDEQPGSYWAFAPEFLVAQGILKPTQRLQGIDFVYMRKAIRDPRPTNELGQALNKDGTVSKQQPAPYFKRIPTYRGEHEKTMLRERAIAEAKEQEMARKGKLALLKNPGQMTCPMCPLTDVCELHEAGQDWEAMLNATFVKWEPYAEHEIRDAELR